MGEWFQFLMVSLSSSEILVEVITFCLINCIAEGTRYNFNVIAQGGQIVGLLMFIVFTKLEIISH